MTGTAAKLTVTNAAELTTGIAAGDRFHDWVRRLDFHRTLSPQ